MLIAVLLAGGTAAHAQGAGRPDPRPDPRSREKFYRPDPRPDPRSQEEIDRLPPNRRERPMLPVKANAHAHDPGPPLLDEAPHSCGQVILEAPLVLDGIELTAGCGTP